MPSSLYGSRAYHWVLSVVSSFSRLVILAVWLTISLCVLVSVEGMASCEIDPRSQTMSLCDVVSDEVEGADCHGDETGTDGEYADKMVVLFVI